MHSTLKSAALASLLVLTACGTNTTDRALSGAGIGAGVGAVGTAIAGGGILTGAVVGGAVGAAAGAISDPDKINLGRPVWRR